MTVEMGYGFALRLRGERRDDNGAGSSGGTPPCAITLILLIEGTRRRDASVEEDATEGQSDTTQRAGRAMSSAAAQRTSVD